MSSERNIICRLLESVTVDDSTIKKSPDELYEDYLTKHVQGVSDAYKYNMLPILVGEGIDKDTLSEIEEIILLHDASKRGDEEWNAYRDYFYDKENNPRSSEAFNYAWKHHQNHNPHHWNYWCLINDVDEPQVQALDMPFKYVIEMLCDWHSAGNFYSNTANDWYSRNKERMMLSPKTREIVEKYLEACGKDF